MQPSMPKKVLVLSIIDIDQALHRPNGGSQRFRLFLDAAGAAWPFIRLVAFTPGLQKAHEDAAAASLIEQTWGVRASVKQVLIPPIKFSNSSLYLSPIFRASHHPEFARYSCESVCQAMIEEMAVNPDFVIVRGQALADYFVRLFGKLGNACLDIDDIGHRKFYRMTKAGEIWGPKWLNLLQIPSRKHYDRSVASKFAVSFVCSETDRIYCRRQLGLKNVRVAPNAMPAHEPMPLAGTRTLLMVGNLSYTPNAKGLELFADQILPMLKQRFSDLELLVAGEAPQFVKERYKNEKTIKFLGFAENLDSVYASSRVVVCPIVSGGGTRVKLIEAAMRGKAIVTTSMGAEGLGFVDRTHALIAETPSSFADACSLLLVDDRRAISLGHEARKLALECFSFNIVRDRLAEDLQVSPMPRQKRQSGPWPAILAGVQAGKE
jgi:glycosyltransferase involved in cell wall biosynthesis